MEGLNEHIPAGMASARGKGDSKGEGILPIAPEHDIYFAEGRGSPVTPSTVILSYCFSRCAD